MIRIHSRRSELVWTTHHALFDGRARLKLIQEFIEVYKALKVGRSVRLKKCPSYEEYLKWTEKQSWKSSSAFWNKQLEDLKETTALNFGMGFKGGKPSGNQQSLKSRFLSSKLSTRLSNWSESQKPHSIYLDKRPGECFYI
ncbi:hypothetical protein F7C95_07160 [Opitutia bacterium ISCC 51]|nr:hypothetical protein F7C95_07160 [Opitutae bacterium ISCC 51]QXD30363.1 hypothetical protein GA003_07120 [Opitutae bacterium ISCC 52]